MGNSTETVSYSLQTIINIDYFFSVVGKEFYLRMPILKDILVGSDVISSF